MVIIMTATDKNYGTSKSGIIKSLGLPIKYLKVTQINLTKVIAHINRAIIRNGGGNGHH